MNGFSRCAIRSITLLIGAAWLSGCGMAYKQSIVKIAQPYQQGAYAIAAANAVKAAQDTEKNNHHDRLALLLEEGTTLRTNTQLAQSTQAFDDADRMFEQFDQKAKVRLSREAYAALVNQAALDYEGYGYDRIMTNVYKAVNNLEAGRIDDARIEIHRIAESQVACEERYKDKIQHDEEEAQKLSKEKNVNVDMKRAQSDPKYQAGEKQVFADFADVQNETPLDNLSHKRLYDNPFAEYLQGLFYLYSGSGGDHEVGRVALRNAAGMMQNNQFAVEDARLADENSAGASPRTYIVFETGVSPSRSQIRIDIPVFLYNVAIHDTRVDYVGLAFPKLDKIDNQTPFLNVGVGNTNYQTQLMADMDKIVAREFKNDFPAILTRAIIGAVIKAGINAGVAEATKNQDVWVQLIARGGTVLYAAATNEADVRTWRTLPKHIQIASFPTPADGAVRLSLPNGAPVATVKVVAGKANMIWVRNSSVTAPCVVRAFLLN
ncbi:MAG TPA: hypothetical protein VHD56_06895 [Tepidisphaeraceae bacterium]|nr:hypothetical protein [Tepidisphaeraceae bacterium]